ncbi:MAG TPA: cytochrome C oxidase subunit IV family protein [Bacteroidia bacterium]|nr:cytochrome C oxidase subunit IV family protein [Bacteroidia bacterium]HRH09681.1 cytochrome C oxidase subunit IV family protein [Bacteroidia bacterium]HRH62364.1 cytochrome C oxidase subunit IV family protein [Bacteroidia bacterium]
MSEFNDNYPQYELMAHHSEEEGKIKRRKLWNVFWIMLGITLVELMVGFYNTHFSEIALKVIFIGFTIVKAGYIVLSFMHLGDEVKAFKYAVLVPFIVFIIYLVFIADLGEGTYAKKYRMVMDKNITDKPQHSEHAEAAHE